MSRPTAFSLSCFLLAVWLSIPSGVIGQTDWERQLESLNAQNRSLDLLDVLKRIPESEITPAINFYHYRTLARLDRPAEMQPLLERTLQNTEMQPYDYLLVASWYRDQGRWQEALQYTEAALQGAPESTDAKLMRLVLIREQVDQTGSDLALNMLAALGLQYRADNPRIEREWIMQISGWPTQRCVDELTRFCRLHPDDGQAHKYLGSLYVRLENGQQAIPYLDRAVELLPRQGNARLVRANALTQLGRMEEARAEHDRAIELEPTGISYHAHGLFRLALESDAQGLEDFLQAYRLNPTEPRMLQDPVQILTQRGEHEKAIQFLNEVAELDPSQTAFLAYWKAWLYSDSNQAQKALASIDTAIESSQDPLLTRYSRVRRVMLNFRFERRDQAMEELAELEMAYPDDPYVRQARQQMEQTTLSV